MADDTNTDTSTTDDTSQSTDTTADDTGKDAAAKGATDALGDAGKQAIDRMKAERNEATKRAKAFETELEKVRTANQSEAEKALAVARKEGAAEAIKASAPRLVSAEFRAAAAGRMTPEQVTELLEDLDLSKYLNDDGEVDTERVTKKVEALAPPPGSATAPSFAGGARKTEPARAASFQEAIANRIATQHR